MRIIIINNHNKQQIKEILKKPTPLKSALWCSYIESISKWRIFVELAH